MCQRLIHHHPIEFSRIYQKHLKRKFPKHQPNSTKQRVGDKTKYKLTQFSNFMKKMNPFPQTQMAGSNKT